MVYQQGAPTPTLLTHKDISVDAKLWDEEDDIVVSKPTWCVIFGDLFLCMQLYLMGLWIVSMENSISSLVERLDVMLDFVLGCLFIVLLWLQLVDIDTWCSHIFMNIFFLTLYTARIPSRISSTSLQHQTKTITKQTHKSDETNNQNNNNHVNYLGWPTS